MITRYHKGNILLILAEEGKYSNMKRDIRVRQANIEKRAPDIAALRSQIRKQMLEEIAKNVK